jgi:hypothetical protein
MKHNNSYGALMILALALIVGVPMIHAQSRTRANVPFDFNLDQKSMSSGSYEISSVNEKVLAVRNLKTGESRLVIAFMNVEASAYQGAPHAKLVFRKYDDQYFLAEIWSGDRIGIQLPESKREHEMKLASASQPETVVIAMK